LTIPRDDRHASRHLRLGCARSKSNKTEYRKKDHPHHRVALAQRLSTPFRALRLIAP
jgi:hypothetical protein